MKNTIFAKPTSDKNTINDTIDTDLIEQLLTLAPNRSYKIVNGFKVFKKLETPEEPEIRNSMIEDFESLVTRCNMATVKELMKKINREGLNVADECLDAIMRHTAILQAIAEGHSVAYGKHGPVVYFKS